ncbi:uncharacterized protein LOC135224181 [Macrobrachium nipponense]|uniref:uncharacterized protein LOC135224181 n=1 Tax=Macrobrachium nipponense TaxID=159736 RepID=UPI0030C8CF5B
MYYPPPPHEGVLPGAAIPTAPLVPVSFPASALEMYMNGSTAPTAPSISQVQSPDSSPLPGALEYWKYHKLHHLANRQQLCISHRRGNCYDLTDTMDTVLYTASIEMQTDCFCCGKAPKGPGTTWHMTNPTAGLALSFHLARELSCFHEAVLTTTVKMASEAHLGRAEGKGSKFTLKNPAGDDLCYLHLDDRCCNCEDIPYMVIPAGDTNDTGDVVKYNGGFLITFPRSLDVPTRALLAATIISIQFHFEEANNV